MTSHPGAGSPDSLLPTLLSVLDVVVLERVEGGAFRQVGGEPPSWFTDAMRNADPGRAVTVVQAFPVLESFLGEADAFWRRTAYGRLEGEAFVVTDAGGQTLPVAPIAAVMEGHHFLLLQRVAGFDERQRVLQRAREQALGHEKLVKQIEELRRPVNRLATIVTDLARHQDPSVPSETMTAVTEQVEKLKALLEQLPGLPPATSARR